MLNLKNKRNGITLIALVITIIVLLILAVVSFKIITGDNGIMNKAENSVSETEKAKAKEQVELFISKQIADYYESGHSGSLIEHLEDSLGDNGIQIGNYFVKKKESQSAKVKTFVKVASLEGAYASVENSTLEIEIHKGKNAQGKLILEGTVSSTGKVQWRDVSSNEQGGGSSEPEPEQDTTAPTITEVTTTTSTVSFTITDDSGVAAYAITEENSAPSDWQALPEPQTTFLATISNLPANTTYYIWAKDTENNETSIPEQATTSQFPNIQTGDVTWTQTWSGSTSTLTLTNNTDYQVQVSKNGTNFNSLSGNTVEVESGETIYIKITDGTNASTNYLSETILRTGTVTYSANGGRGEVPTSHTESHTQNVTVKTDTTPTRNGYFFQGWNTSSTATTTISSFTMPAEDVTLYAVWRKATQAENSEHPEWHIPTGFAHTVGNVNDGYVISDGTNEFVWIPVPDEARYTKKLGTNNWYLKTAGTDTASDLSNIVSNGIRGDVLGINKILDIDVTSTLSASSPESAVVYAAGGFWVGRYEAGITSIARSGNLISSISDASFDDSTKALTSNTFWDSQTIIVSQNAEPVRLITQEKALEKANNWNSGNANETAGTVKFQSGLITGAQWDAMCKFIDWGTCDSDCSSWGNYYKVASISGYSGLRSESNDTTWKSGLGQKNESTISIFPTGVFSGSTVASTAKKNIYDIAGNVYEWTTEVPQYNANNAVTRGNNAGNSSRLCELS